MNDHGALNLLATVNRSRSAAAGLDSYHYDAVTATIDHLDRWPEAFEATAELFIARAEKALSEGKTATADEAFAIAALWLHFATCVPSSDRNRIVDLLLRAAIAHRRSLALEGSSAEYFGPDRTGGHFAAILERPDAAPPVPVLIIVSGLDSSKEEFADVATVFRRRGLATLRIDGPGQGEMLAQTGPRAEYERVLRAVIDLITTVPGLDASRIGALGLSLGGYYVPRAAAFEPRIKAAVAVTGPFAFGEWHALPQMIRQIVTLRTGDEQSARAFTSGIDLAPLVSTIRQPLLVVAGGRDPMVPAADARRLAAEAPHADLLEIRDGDHLCANRRWEWQARAADWVAYALGRGDDALS
jgi:dienelactone hydrolase